MRRAFILLFKLKNGILPSHPRISGAARSAAPLFLIKPQKRVAAQSAATRFWSLCPSENGYRL